MTMPGAAGPFPPGPDGTAEGVGGEPRDAGFGARAGGEHLVQEGLNHLQRAARETIAAMRALLDIAEQLVDDPAAAETLVATIGSVAEGAVRSGVDRARQRRTTTPTSPEDDDDGGRVQRIPVS